MATWTDIPDEVLEPGKPIRSVDALALRDNPIAIAQGAAGAPRIAGQQGPAVNTGGLFNGAVTAAKLAAGAAENSWVLARTAAGATAGAVGTYAIVMFRAPGSSVVNWGQTVAGSNLTPSMLNSYSGTDTLSPALSGTWRIMGRSISRSSTGSHNRIPNLAVRIS